MLAVLPILDKFLLTPFSFYTVMLCPPMYLNPWAQPSDRRAHISKSTKMCQGMTDFHRVCNVPTVVYSIPEAPESPSSPAIYSRSTTKQLVLHIWGSQHYNTNTTVPNMNKTVQT